jgi:hypothetical protein
MEKRQPVRLMKLFNLAMQLLSRPTPLQKHIGKDMTTALIVSAVPLVNLIVNGGIMPGMPPFYTFKEIK